VQQLSGLDASFLNMETATTYGHVSGLAIFDPSTAQGDLDLDAVKRLLEERLHLIPPFRRKLAEVPLGLDHPYWVDDPDFDIDFHVRELALPAPGTKWQLAEQVARIVARPLDRRRPLWELYLITGLEDDYVAQLTKIHHAAIDGASGAELMTVLLDMTPEVQPVPPPDGAWRPGPVPSDLQMLGRALVNLATQPQKAFRMQRRLLRELPTIARQPGVRELPGVRTAAGIAARVGGRPAHAEGEVLRRPRTTAPRVSFNRSITPHRRFAFDSLSLDDVKAIKNAAGTTVNDVVMALCAGGLRRWLIDHDELPPNPLVAAIPVSVRTEEQKGELGNRVSTMLAPLHTDVADPVERLRRIHEETKDAKEAFKALPADMLQDFAQFATPAVAARASRASARLRLAERLTMPFNLIISNVPGPNFPLYSFGAKLVAQYPVSAVADGQGLNMTVQSYMGHLDFGLVACRELVPDLWDLMDHVGDALEELKHATLKEQPA